MNEQETTAPADDWQLRIAAARTALGDMIEAPHLTPGARAALNKFFDEVEQLAEDAVDDDTLRCRLAALLTGVANGLRGAPAPLSSHSWADLPERAEAMALEVSNLHRQLAHATLRADQGWERYESANRDRNAIRTRVAELEAIWHDPAKLHANLLKSGYPRHLALHLAGATDYDSLADQLKAIQIQLHVIKVTAGPLAKWFGALLVEYADTNDSMSMENKHILMGKGDASVTAGDLRALLAAISHVNHLKAAP